MYDVNEMKKLINNIQLVSTAYMNSNNNILEKQLIKNNLGLVLPGHINSNSTVNKFGTEYSYIAIAMNTMLGFTNNHVKNINVNGNYGIVIDYNWNCIITLIGFVSIGILIIEAAGGITIDTDAIGTPAIIWLLSSFVYSTSNMYGVATACGW